MERGSQAVANMVGTFAVTVGAASLGFMDEAGLIAVTIG
jgi:hypothetical protein